MPFDRRLITLNAVLGRSGLLPGPGRLGASRWTANVRWETTGRQGIHLDPENDIWISGRVLALLPLDGGGVVVGAEGSGVWLVDTAGGSIGVSHDWTRPDVLSLAQGPRGRRDVFAGCDGSMYRTNTRASLPILEWTEVGSNGRRVHSIAVSPTEERVVIATDDGVWLARTQLPPYTWQRAAGLAPGGYSSVARADGNTILAAAWGGGPGSNFGGIFVGKWVTQQGFPRPIRTLRFQPAVIAGLWFPQNMGRISLAVCEGDRRRAYAIVADATNDQTLAILRSDDAGRNWHPIHGLNPGSQASRDQCIAVAASDPDVVAFGGRLAGPVLSRDGGNTWDVPLEGCRNTSLLHSDLNALAFDPDDDSNQRLFVGSDGGVVVTSDFGQSYDTGLNRNLPTVQFLREPFATSSGSSRVAGLFGGGTQDNGNVFQASSASEWLQSEGGDGHAYVFLSDGRLLRFANGTEGLHLAAWNGTTFDDLGKSNPAGGYQGRWFEPKLARVRGPAYRDRRGLLIVVAGQGRNLFGLFDAGSALPTWHSVAAVPRVYLPSGVSRSPSIEGVGSLSGDVVYAGTNDASLYAIDVATGKVRKLTVGAAIADARLDHHVRSPIVVANNLGFALLYRSGGAPAVPSIPVQAVGLLLRSRDLEHWDPVPNTPAEDGPVYAIEVDDRESPQVLFAATDSTVWASYDEGNSWGFAGTGLPARAHSADIRIVERGRKERWLYLATYGRSAWRARVSPPPALEPPTTPAVGASAQLAACGGKADRVELFWAGVDGSIITAAWAGPSGWQTATASNPRASLAGAPVSVIARAPNQVEVFWVGRDGGVRTTARTDGRKWTGNTAVTPPGVGVAASHVCSIGGPSGPAAFWSAGDGAISFVRWSPLLRAWGQPGNATTPRAALPGCPVAAIGVGPDEMSVFWVQRDGAVATTGWDAGQRTWTQARTIASPGAALPGSPVAVAGRNPSHVDVFWIGIDGAVWTTWSDPAGAASSWERPFAITDANVATPGTALSAGAPALDHVDVGWVGSNGGIGHTFWNTSTGRWSPVAAVAPPDASFAGSPIALVGRTAKHLDLFWLGLDTAIGSAWSERGPYGGPWTKPFPITGPDAAQLPDHLDVFLGSVGGGLRSTWWDRLVPSGWSPTFPISAESISSSGRPIGADSSDPDHVDALIVDTSGTLSLLRWDGSPTGTGWSTPQPIDTGLSEKGPLAVASIGPDQIDVAYVDTAGRVVSRSWNGAAAVWSQPTTIAPPGAIRADSTLSEIAVHPDHVELYFIGTDGSIQMSERDRVSTNGAWAAPVAVSAPNAARAGSDIAGLARATNHVDVFYVRPDGRLTVLSSSVSRPRAWTEATPLGYRSTVRADSPIVALSRSPDHAEVYIVDPKGTIRTATFDRTQSEWDSGIVSSAGVPAGSALAGAVRSRHHVDLFWSGPAGELMTTWSDRFSPWAAPFAAAPAGSATGAIRAITRSGRLPAGFAWAKW